MKNKTAVLVATVTFSLRFCASLHAQNVSGRIYLADNHNVPPNVTVESNLSKNFGLEQGVLVDRQQLDTAFGQYAVEWTRSTFTNGNWYYRSLYGRSTAKKNRPNDGNVFATSEPTFSVSVRLVQRRVESGETDYSGSNVKLRLKRQAHGQVTVTEARNDGGSPSYGSATYSLNGNFTHTWHSQSSDQGGFDHELWDSPITMKANSSTGLNFTDTFRVIAQAFNISYVVESEVVIESTFCNSDFQVLDSSGALIWDYSKNADGSPGDKWVMQIFDNPTSTWYDVSPGEPLPSVAVRKDINGDILLDFVGLLEESNGLNIWSPIDPYEITPYRIPNTLASNQFFRARSR